MKENYKILQIDVWGNEEDGYDKNDFFNIGTIQLDEEEDIIERLIKEEYLIENADEILECNDINGMGEYYEITYKSNGKPALDLAIIGE